ncbi:hypothetical protein [Psychrobacter sp. AT9]|uniref:hypothetical protein n=1 Tax=Psychrobacter sp. AT9 TaxID=3242893 RepID=UPI0039A64158
MKRLAVVALCLALVGCGGDDDIEPIRDALDRPGVPSTGGGSSGGNGNPSTPTPDSDSLWEYEQTEFSRFARIKSTNTVPTANGSNDAIMQVELQKYTTALGEVITYLRITVFFAETDCDVSCNIRIKKNGSAGGVYTAQEFVERVFTNDSFSARDLRSLIKDVTVSSNASITVPLTKITPESPTEGEFLFNFSGYDTKFMR